MTIAQKVAYTLGVLSLGFVVGAYANRPVAVVHAAPAITHVVNGLTLSDAQFSQQLAVQQAANDKMQEEYVITQVQERAALETKMNALVLALAKKAQKDHGTFVVSPVKHDTSL